MAWTDSNIFCRRRCDCAPAKVGDGASPQHPGGKLRALDGPAYRPEAYGYDHCHALRRRLQPRSVFSIWPTDLYRRCWRRHRGGRGPNARQVWLGLSVDLDETESLVTIRVEAPGYDHALTITIPPGPTNTGLMFPVTVPAGDQGSFQVSVSNLGGPDRQFTQRWRLDAADGAEILASDAATNVLKAANEATTSVFAQIAAKQAAAKH